MAQMSSVWPTGTSVTDFSAVYKRAAVVSDGAWYHNNRNDTTQNLGNRRRLRPTSRLTVLAAARERSRSKEEGHLFGHTCDVASLRSDSAPLGSLAEHVS